MGVMHVLDQSGDVTVEWNPADDESVAAAKAEWEKLAEAGFEMYDPTTKGKRRLKKFDRKRGRVIAVPGVKSDDDRKTGERSKAMAGGPNASVLTP